MANKYEYREAVKERGGEKKLDHLRIIPGDGGGHTVEHHYQTDGLILHKKVSHDFGENEGHDLLAHIAEAASIKVEPPEKMEEEP